MSEDRGARDRRLIERTAALLSEDFPLQQLLSRVVEVVRSELRATGAGIALHGENGLEIVAVSGSLDGCDLHNERGPSMRAYAGLEPILASGDRCELSVPIRYRDTPLGVLTVCTDTPMTLDTGDADLLLPVARYLGLAVRNQGSTAYRYTVWRRPAYVVTVLVLAGMLLSLGLATVGFDQAHRMDQSMRDAATARLASVSSTIEDYLQDAGQLADSTAVLVAGKPQTHESTEATLVRLLQSASNPAVYGVGVWYQPFTYDARTRLYGPYARYDARRHAAVTYEWMRASYDFPRQPWYTAGLAAHGRVVFTDPYFDTDAIYFTAVRSFRGLDGRVAGVVTVDSIIHNMSAMLSRPASPGTIAVVRSARGTVLFTSDDAAILAFSAQRGAPVQTTWNVRDATLRAFLERSYRNAFVARGTVPDTGWQVVVYAIPAPGSADDARTQTIVCAAIVTLWIGIAVAAIAIVRASRHRRRARTLEYERHSLEREIADRLSAEERLREQAYRDELTGLPNRAFVRKHLAQSFKEYASGSRSFAVLFIDIDRFNLINDSLGHASGDVLLVEFAQRLRYALGDGDVLARLGGDEYVIVVDGATASSARERAAAVNAVLRHPFALTGHELFVSVSIGIAVADRRYASGDELLRDADGAMYEAKRAGRSTVRTFDQSMHTRATEQLALDTDLRRALELGELFCEYQPIVSLETGRIAGFEALARWNHGVRGRVQPDIFIRLAEQSGNIVTLDQQIISQATRDAMRWQREFPGRFVSVNASAAHLARIDDIAAIKTALTGSGLSPELLKVEITETAVMENGDKAREVLVHLRGMGVRLVIDDFGTGYSSLSYLQQLPVEELKIDRSFVSMMLHNEQASEIVRAIVAVAKTLHLRVTAEGVETADQLERLKRLGVEYAQGYAFGMPRPFESVVALLRAEADESHGTQLPV